MRVLKPILRNLLAGARRVVVVDDQREWRGIDLYIASQHLAKRVGEATDRPHVGIMLPTSGLFPMALIATWRLGRTAVPLNYLLKPDDLAYVLEDAGVDTVITAGPMLEAFGALPGNVQAIKLDEMRFGGVPPLRRAVSKPDDHLAVLLYTSGTSGRPKGVMLSAGNLAANVQQIIEFVGFSSDDTVMGVLPQFHSFGLTVLTLLPLSTRSKAVYTARFNPRRTLKLLEEHRPTTMVAIPSMYNALLGTKNATPDHFATIRFLVSGGEPLPAAVFDGFRDRFGVTINEGYGLTETAPVANWCRPQDHRRHSVGLALPGVEEKIVGPGGDALPVDEDGEVWIRGANVMQGYYNLPDETAAVLDGDGWFKTGDMGRIDADGHLYITGRIKEMLIIGGENVFPREIEEVLNTHAAVHDSAVIGMHDQTRGEVALAFVEMVEDATFDEASLRSHCREALPQYKVPRDIRVIEALPRNATGKIMRRELSAETPSMVEP